MVHNGIEYGMMAAIAEGLSIIKHANVGKAGCRSADAETTPLRDPQYYQYDIDVAEVAEVWRRGSVVSSWLVDLTADALARSPQLDDFAGHVSDSGEGRWTVIAAMDEGVPAPVITTSLFERFESRGLGEFSHKLLSALRSEFGGHPRRSLPLAAPGRRAGTGIRAEVAGQHHLAAEHAGRLPGQPPAVLGVVAL